MVPPELTCNSSRCHRPLQSQDEGFALIPPAATTEPSSGVLAGPEELAFEDARSSGGDADQDFLHEEDLSLEKDFGASDGAGVQEKGGSSDQAEGREEDVEKPTHVLEEELAHAKEETRKAQLEALANAAKHETVKQNLFRAETAFQNAGGEFAGAAIAVAQAEAEAANTPTSVPESVPQEDGEEGDGSAAEKNEEKEEEAEGAEEGDGSAAEKNEEKEEEAEGAEEDAGEEKEKEVAEVKAREVEAAAGRQRRDNAGVIGRRYSDSQFKPPGPRLVKPVPRDSGASGAAP